MNDIDAVLNELLRGNFKRCLSFFHESSSHAVFDVGELNELCVLCCVCCVFDDIIGRRWGGGGVVNVKSKQQRVITEVNQLVVSGSKI